MLPLQAEDFSLCFFYFVAHVGLELVASLSSGITGVNSHNWPVCINRTLQIIIWGTGFHFVAQCWGYRCVLHCLAFLSFFFFLSEKSICKSKVLGDE